MWSASRGYPMALTEVDQRTIYGGSASEPLTAIFSELGAFDRFRPGTLADSSFNYMASPPRRRQSRIRWIEANDRYLFMGSAAGIVVGRASDDSQGFTPETTRFYPGPTEGASRVQAELIGGRVVYVSTDRRKLYSITYDLTNDTFQARPLNLAARHVLDPGVAWMAWQEMPWRVLWLGLLDGTLASLTLEQDAEQQVVGFHRHPMGGFVESGAVKPTDDDAAEELWLTVRRTLGGVERRCVEVMASPFGLDNRPDAQPPLADAWHLMCAVRYEGVPARGIGGLGHLEGETVYAWTDLGAFGPFTVEDGMIALPEDVTSAIVGIDVSEHQVLRTLDIQAGATDGGAQGRLKNMRGVGVQLLHTAGGTARTVQQDDDGTERFSREVDLIRQPRFKAPRLLSGVADIDSKFGWSHTLKVEFRPAPGAPITVQGITPTLQATDG